MPRVVVGSRAAWCRAGRAEGAEAGGERAPELGGAVEDAAEDAGAAGGVEAHGEVDLRAQSFAPLEDGVVLGEVVLEALAVAVAGVERRAGAGDVGRGVEAARDAEDLEVGLDRVGERLEALAYLDLALLGEAGVAVSGQLVDGPGVGRGAQDEVAPEEAMGRPHRCTSGSKAPVAALLP